MQDKGLCEQCVFSNNGHHLPLSFKRMRGDLPITPSSLNLAWQHQSVMKSSLLGSLAYPT